VSSSEEPKNAAAHPAAASAITPGTFGALRSAGGASSKVKIDSTNAVSEIAATIQNRGRHAFACACRPPTNGPSATAPKMQMFMITAVSRSLSLG
jgi:hypothetical protein